jgi:hypothetical protein
MAGLYTVRIPQYGVCLIFDRLQDQRGGVGAELTITLGSTELLSGVDLGLKSDTGQTKLSTSLNKFTSTIPWKLILQRACSLVLCRYRTGAPTLLLTGDTPVEPLTYVVNPIAFKKKTTIMVMEDSEKARSRCSSACVCQRTNPWWDFEHSKVVCSTWIMKMTPMSMCAVFRPSYAAIPNWLEQRFTISDVRNL